MGQHSCALLKSRLFECPTFSLMEVSAVNKSCQASPAQPLVNPCHILQHLPAWGHRTFLAELAGFSYSLKEGVAPTLGLICTCSDNFKFFVFLLIYYLQDILLLPSGHLVFPEWDSQSTAWLNHKLLPQSSQFHFYTAPSLLRQRLFASLC